MASDQQPDKQRRADEPLPGDEIAPSGYRKLPVVIQAIRWSGRNLRQVIDFTGLHESAAQWSWDEYEEVVRTKGFKVFSLEGPHMVSVGDYIIKGVGSRRAVTLPGSRLERSDPMAVRTADLAGMTFDLIAGSHDGLGITEVDRLTVQVVDVEGYSVLAVSADDASSIKLIRRDPRFHLTNANVRLSVHFLTVSGLLQTLPAPGSSLFASGRGPRWTHAAPTEVRTESGVSALRLERGAALSANEVMQHHWILPDFYACKPDIFWRTYQRATTPPSATGAPSHLPLANAIAAMKPEWGVGEESRAAWKQFVEGFQSGRLVVSETPASASVDWLAARANRLRNARRYEAANECDDIIADLRSGNEESKP